LFGRSTASAKDRTSWIGVARSDPMSRSIKMSLG